MCSENDNIDFNVDCVINPPVLATFANLRIGSYYGDNMDGYMDEIMVFSEALDAERVRRLMVL